MEIFTSSSVVIFMISLMLSRNLWNKNNPSLKDKRPSEFMMVWIMNGWLGFMLASILTKRLNIQEINLFYIFFVLLACGITWVYHYIMSKYYQKNMSSRES